MNLYTCTIGNRFYWEMVATMAPTQGVAEDQIAAYLASDEIKKQEAEERGMWLDEGLGDYPGDAAYRYVAGEVKQEWAIHRITERYFRQIWADKTGKVWHIDSGGNG